MLTRSGYVYRSGVRLESVGRSNSSTESPGEGGERLFVGNTVEGDERSMNMSLLHSDDGGDTGGRYGQFRLGEDGLVVYDRENSAAWVWEARP